MKRMMTIAIVLTGCATLAWAQGRSGGSRADGNRAAPRRGMKTAVKASYGQRDDRVGRERRGSHRDRQRARRGSLEGSQWATPAADASDGCRLQPARGNRGRGQSQWSQGSGRRQHGSRNGMCRQQCQGQRNGRRSGLGADRRTDAGMLSTPEQNALRTALLDEYAAEAYYTSVMDKFGSLRKLENIRAAERRHAQALLGLFDRYGIEPPQRTETDVPTVPETLKAALQLAVNVEIGNGALYDELIGVVSHEDVRAVFERLRHVSLTRHLPALQRGV